jgi:hypothetical protein
MSSQELAHQGRDRTTRSLDDVRRIAIFLSRVAPFSDLSLAERQRIASTVEKWGLTPGSALLVEGGPPGARLFVVFDGILELTTGR